ncbi:hypothetical protein I2I11_14895 [Pontibacter sp. 172403-2]|nr:hypothetical protein [Pontibacter sp. 172403-2]
MSRKVWPGLLVVLTGIFLAGATQPEADIQPIVLRAEPLPFTPKEFYIATVIDERKDPAAIAYLLPEASTTAKPAARPVDLQGGGLKAIRQYIQKSMPANTKLRPITIRLKECRVTETPGDKGRVQGHVAVAMGFELQQQGEEEPVQLLTYKGGAKYNRPANQLSVVEPVLRQSLADALTYLNTWMNQEAGRNPKLAKSLTVSVKDYTRNADDDTVFYAVSRPLVWDDFRASPNTTSHFAASVFPGFAYEGQAEVEDGIIKLDITMKVYVLRSSSWVKAAARNSYSLNHEQRHFDIVKLVAERFKQKMKPENLTLEDYNSIMQYQYIESFREMNHLQEQYDGETRHGIDEAAQQQWNNRIDKELRSFGIK